MRWGSLASEGKLHRRGKSRWSWARGCKWTAGIRHALSGQYAGSGAVQCRPRWTHCSFMPIAHVVLDGSRTMMVVGFRLFSVLGCRKTGLDWSKSSQSGDSVVCFGSCTGGTGEALGSDDARNRCTHQSRLERCAMCLVRLRRKTGDPIRHCQYICDRLVPAARWTSYREPSRVSRRNSDRVADCHFECEASVAVG